MREIDDATLAKFGLSTLTRRSGGAVAIVARLRKDWVKGAAKDIVSIERWMQHWCDGRDLPPERFKVNLRRGEGIRIDEFKSYQLRAYGFSLTIGDKKLFVVTALDIKKKDKASNDVLDRAERLARELRSELGYD